MNLNFSSFGFSLSHATNAAVQEEHNIRNDVKENHEDVGVSSEGSTHGILEVKEKLLEDRAVEGGFEVGLH